MTQECICQICGKKINTITMGAFCSACLLKAALQEDEDVKIKDKDWDVPAVDEMVLLFPEFESFSFLSRGGMGAVFKAWQKNLNRWIAIKVLPPEIGRQITFAERFSKEAQALAKLNHPGIVTIHDFGVKGEFYFFVMEYVSGQSLAEILKKPLDFSFIQKMMLQLCDILEYAHQQGILHCDLKPENIFWTENDQIKLMDFGISQMIVEKFEENIIIGTPAYMAPELCKHKAPPSIQSDIYSLGVVFYQMLTGNLPKSAYQHFLPAAISQQIPQTIPSIIDRALAIDPSKRYSTMKNFGAVIRAATKQRKMKRYSFVVLFAVIILAIFIISLFRDKNVNQYHSNETFVLKSEEQLVNVEVIHPYDLELPGGVHICLQPVQAGNFMMGSNEFIGYAWEQPVHCVVISKPFWIGQYEITQAQYQTIMGRNPSVLVGYDLPVTNISWEDANEFCQRLNQIEALADLPKGYIFRLPTEAEWEYVAQGGNFKEPYKYSGSNQLKEVAWIQQNSKEKIQSVGKLKSNRLNVFDMTGNVAEWCLDYFSISGYKNGIQINPLEKEDKEEGYVVRGGHIQTTTEEDFRNAARASSLGATSQIGLRIVLAPER